jgi:cytochrome P450
VPACSSCRGIRISSRKFADLDKNVPIAAEEIIRFCAPAQYTFRIAHKNVTVAGQSVKAGRRVACLLHSASRDERGFAKPDTFVWNRPIERVLSFGLGQHHCIGKHLAKLEVVTLIREFLAGVDAFEFVASEGRAQSKLFQAGMDQLARRRRTLGGDR